MQKSGNPLTSRPIPKLFQEQLDKFSKESTRARPVEKFDPNSTIEKLKNLESEKVIAIDIGGNKIESAVFEVKKNDLEQDKTKSQTFHSSLGKDYLEFMEKISGSADLSNTPIGISFAGPLEATKPIEGPNIPMLMSELKNKYRGDFAQLFPTLKAVVNDAVAGIIAGSMYAQKAKPKSSNIIFIINGSGIGGSVLKGGEIFSAEPGHVDIIPKLNQYHQTDPCQFTGNVCIENVAAGRAGIEDIWEKQTGKNQEGPEIANEMENGNELAIALYDNSALLTAHAAIGLAKSFDLLKTPQDTTAVFHGGVLLVPGYATRVKQIMQKYLGFEPQFLVTSDFSPNACLDGAAIAALSSA